MTDKPIVSEILPAGAACAQWLQEGDNARAVPFVAFAAGWKARDAEVAAADAVREAAFGVTQAWLCEPDLTLDMLKPHVIALIEALDREADIRAGER